MHLSPFHLEREVCQVSDSFSIFCCFIALFLVGKEVPWQWNEMGSHANITKFRLWFKCPIFFFFFFFWGGGINFINFPRATISIEHWMEFDSSPLKIPKKHAAALAYPEWGQEAIVPPPPHHHHHYPPQWQGTLFGDILPVHLHFSVFRIKKHIDLTNMHYKKVGGGGGG